MYLYIHMLLVTRRIVNKWRKLKISQLLRLPLQAPWKNTWKTMENKRLQDRTNIWPSRPSYLRQPAIPLRACPCFSMPMHASFLSPVDRVPGFAFVLPLMLVIVHERQSYLHSPPVPPNSPESWPVAYIDHHTTDDDISLPRMIDGHPNQWHRGDPLSSCYQHNSPTIPVIITKIYRAITSRLLSCEHIGPSLSLPSAGCALQHSIEGDENTISICKCSVTRIFCYRGVL